MNGNRAEVAFAEAAAVRGERKPDGLERSDFPPLEIQGMEAEIIVASTRSPRHVIDGAIAGATIATVPFKVVQQMVKHPLTDKGLEIRQVEQIGYDDSLISIQGRNGVDHVECCTEHTPAPVFTRHRDDIDIVTGA